MLRAPRSLHAICHCNKAFRGQAGASARRGVRGPRSRRTGGALAAGLAVVVSAPLCLGQQWAPPIQKVPHLFVQIEVLGVRGGVTRSLGRGTIEASPGKPGTLSLPIDLGPDSADHPTAIEIEVTQTKSEDPKLGVSVATTVSVRGRSGDVARVRRERVAQVDEGRSFFHQAYENPSAGTSVLLTMTPESRIVPELVKPQTSAPVVFNITLSRVTESGEVPLEDNELRTMEGSAVSYAFRIALADSMPVEAAPPAPDAAAPPRGDEDRRAGSAVSDADVSARPATSAGSGTKEPGKNAKKTKKKSKQELKQERENELLDQFRRSRQESAGGSDAAREGAVAPAKEGSAPSPVAGTPPDPAAIARADELELTLLPHRVESGILLVEASLRGIDASGGGSERASLVRETHALTPKGTFAITVSGKGPAGAGSYRFLVQATF